jgi:hypothetical protein
MKKVTTKTKANAKANSPKKTPKKPLSASWAKGVPNTSVHPLHVFSPKAEAALVKIRAICNDLHGATEKVSHGAPWFFAKKGFLAFYEDHHGDERIAIWVRGIDGQAGMLVQSDPARFFIPPYVGKSGWFGMRLDLAKTDWTMVRALVTDGFIAGGGKL